jgi:glycosyltransferase involved in cell wall biosynthesis
MSRIRLAYLVSTLGRTGPTRQLYNLVKYIDHEQFDVSIVTLSDNPTANLEADFKGLGTRIYPIRLSRLKSALVGTRHLKRVLREIRPNILHSQGIRPDWLASKLDQPYIRIATQRNTPLSDYPALMGRWTGKLVAIVHERALSTLPMVVTCSHALTHNNTHHRNESCIIHNGVDLLSLRCLLDQPTNSARRAKLGLPDNKRLFIFAGPLIPRKDPILLIKVLKLRASKDDALVMLGDGPLLPKCKELAADVDNIFLPGEKSNILEYLNVADCFVSASYAEGLPNAVLEALACGLPVLLSDIPSHREILTHSREAGEMFSAGYLTSLNQAIENFSITPDRRTAARLLATNHFSAEAMSHAYQTLYRQQIAVMNQYAGSKQ